jgi:AT-rich interactive domain-containing protein 1
MINLLFFIFLQPDGIAKLYEMSDEPDRKRFLDKLIQFNEERNTNCNTCPSVNKQPLDLFKLYILVKEHGGFSEVTKSKKWKEIGILLMSGDITTTVAYTIRKQYIKHLLPFECKFDRGGIEIQSLLNQVEPKEKNKKNIKSAPSPSATDSNSQGSYPQSVTPVSLDGSGFNKGAYHGYPATPGAGNPVGPGGDNPYPPGYVQHHSATNQVNLNSSNNSSHKEQPPVQQQHMYPGASYGVYGKPPVQPVPGQVNAQPGPPGAYPPQSAYPPGSYYPNVPGQTPGAPYEAPHAKSDSSAADQQARHAQVPGFPSRPGYYGIPSGNAAASQPTPVPTHQPPYDYGADSSKHPAYAGRPDQPTFDPASRFPPTSQPEHSAPQESYPAHAHASQQQQPHPYPASDNYQVSVS